MSESTGGADSARGPWGPWWPGFLITLVAAATTWATLTSWHDFVTEPGTYLRHLFVVALVVVCVGTVLRWRRAPDWSVLVVQFVVVLWVVCYQVTGSLVPLGGGLADLRQALSVSVDAARSYAAPLGPDVPPVWPLMLIGGAIFLVLVDAIACTYRRVPAAGLALLAVYSVPSGLLDGGPGVTSFVGATIGFLILLHLDARAQLPRWGRVLETADRADRPPAASAAEAFRAGAIPIGVTATALALILPTFIPTLGVDVLGFGESSGSGDIRIRKPIADMRRDLERGRDVPMITIETNDPSPSYLRVAVLNRFTGQEWSSGDRDVSRENQADGALPVPEGLDTAVPRSTYSYAVEINNNFDSTWLPTQFPASEVDAEGDWRFDPASMDFLAARDDLNTRGLAYTMRGLDLDYGTDGAFFRNSEPGAVSEEVLDLPGVPGLVRDLARSVTGPAGNDYERALLLQRWFRQDGGFTYDLAKAPEGSGNDTLESFLSEDGRVGYCEQYASAMAVMARLLGIPARVAIGFLEPNQLVDGRWQYSSHDLHAWPELYFEGAGWVRFEPTPAGRVDSVPAYSRVQVGNPGPDNPDNSPTNSQAPEEDPTTAAPAPTADASDQTDPEAGAQDGSDRSTVRRLLAPLAVALAVLLVLALGVIGPRTVRDRSRRRRLDGGPEEVWAEVRATALDLGIDWPEDRSPRETADVVRLRLGDPDAIAVERPATGPEAAPAATAALDRLLLTLERERYARAGSTATLVRSDLHADGQVVIDALTAGATPRGRQRARWLPQSLWRR